MKLHTIALGCQMSGADAEEMSEAILARGGGRAAAVAQADVILVSTCTVRDHAEQRALSLIGRLKPWKEADPRRVLIVAGCAAERLGESLRRRFPHVDLVAGAKSVGDFPRLVEEALGERFDALRESAEAFGEAAPPTSPVAAPLTIMRGCNYSCSYCIVPAVRGRELYRETSDILAEARRRVAAGCKEITLLGQTVNSWHDAGLRFPDLLRKMDEVDGLERVRFMSPHPHFVDSALAEALAGARTGCPQLHLPAQSGSDRILGLMRRNYTAAGFLKKATLVRRAVPSVVVSTDIIVGFPTETEEDFARTLELVEALKPAWAYTFKYSPRAGTESASLPGGVPEAVAEERLARLNALVERLARCAHSARIGATLEVLGEQPGFGKSREGFKVRCPGLEPGKTAAVRVTAATDKTLSGELHEP